MREHEVITVKKYNEYLMKITYLQSVCVGGWEDKREHNAKGTVNDSKLLNNLSRAKNKVKEYALCNPWDYFVTLTIDKEKFDRYNLEVYQKKFCEYLHGYNKRCDENDKVAYLLIPEQHKDGAWHMHGLIKGIRKKDIIINKNGYLTWKKYNDKFGYMSMDTIKDKDKVSSYILKYITKDISKNVNEINAHLYYASKGLKTAEVVLRSNTVQKKYNFPWDWEHPDGYVKNKLVDTRKEKVSDYLEIENEII